VHEWLKMLKMDDLWPLFEARGYTDMNRISSRGLKQDDLDKIGVRTCVCLALLLASAYMFSLHTCAV
jgi:hypothetical protein